MFFLFGGMGASVGACIAMQDAIIGEKESGTAAWVLSKSLSRVAFIAGKLCANSLGMLFGYQGVLQVAPFLKDIMPYQLVVPLGEAGLPMAGQVLHGQTLATIMPIIGSAIAIVLFVIVALWRFEREEF